MRVLVLALAALILLPAAASARTIDVPKTLKAMVIAAKYDTKVPILLPQTYKTDAHKLYQQGIFARKRYTFSLGSAQFCNGAPACFVADFGGKRGGKPHYTRKVKLRGGRTGYFKPLTCGASCSAPAIEWRKGRVLYWIQAHAGTKRQEKRRLVKMANSALQHGPR